MYHVKPSTVPRAHKDIFKKGVETLFQLGVLYKTNSSNRLARTIIQPKNYGKVTFLFNFRKINQRICIKLFSTPK